MVGYKFILSYLNNYDPSHLGNQRAISGINITNSIPIICRAMNGRTDTKISCSVISAGATDFNQKHAGPNGGDKKYI